MNAMLEFPPIDEIDNAPAAQAADAPAPSAVTVAEPQPGDLATMDLKALALSGFYPHRRQAEEAKAALTGLVIDLSNQARIDEAKSLRWRLIGQPLADMRKLAKGMKSTLAAASKAIGGELEAVEAKFTEADALITPQIQAREDELEAEREARAQAEAERKARHEQGIAQIRAYVQQARDANIPAAGILAGITNLDNLSFGDDWDEYRELAVAARDETRAALVALHAQVQAREEQAAETERLRRLAEQQEAELAALRREKQEREERERAEREAAERARIEAEERTRAVHAAAREHFLAENPPAELQQTLTPQDSPAPATAVPPVAESPECPIPDAEAAPGGDEGPIPVGEATELPPAINRVFRKHIQASPAPSLRHATAAELRSEWLLFAAALEHVRPVIQKHAAQVDATRFERAVDRLHQAFVTTIEEITAC